MKKLILISALLFSFNGLADQNGVMTLNNREETINLIDKLDRTTPKNKALAFGINNKKQLAWAFCGNYRTVSLARSCALKECQAVICRIVGVNDNAYEDILSDFTQELGWNNLRSNNQPRSTNNQSEQMQILELCLQRQAEARANAHCSVPPTKQGGFAGFAQQVNACRAQRAQMYPDSVCFGAPQPRYETPQKNNSVELCNFKCWGGQIVQGDCNSPAVTVNGGMCPRM